jgi:two-component system, OmpR family, response regulator RstA
MQRIVFVEDDAEIGLLIKGFLGKHDLDVALVNRGDTAMAIILQEQPDLVLLDIMLPGMDGLTLCRNLRPQYTGPIVMLTSLDSDMNHILGLELGANDYILKTIPPSVLLARLRVQLRQQNPTQPAAESPASGIHPLHFGQLTIDPTSRDVILAGQNIPLSTSDFDLLWELASHAGHIMSRESLLKVLRGVEYDGLDRSVDVAISRLRRKLDDSAQEPTRIKTVRNKGYLLAPAAWN